MVGGHGLRFQLQSRLCSNSMFAFPEMRRCSLYTILTCHLLVSWCSVSFGLCRQQGARQRCGRAQRVSHRASSHRVQNHTLTRMLCDCLDLFPRMPHLSQECSEQLLEARGCLRSRSRSQVKRSTKGLLARARRAAGRAAGDPRNFETV